MNAFECIGFVGFYMVDKFSSFEYLLYRFMLWYEELNHINDEAHHQFLREFSRLKSLKLLFLVSAIKDEEGNNLLSLFNNFYAMQHGPVESDIYNAMVHDTFEYFKFQNRQTSFKKQTLSDLEKIENKECLDNAISLLREANPDIVSYPAMDLVDITHKWISWKSAYMVAQMLGKGSQFMPTEMIENSNEFFS